MTRIELQDKAQQVVTAVREKRPLVHNITNYVVMNFSANALLAFGASPVMAHATEEIEDMVAIADALVINIGTLSSSWIEAMRLAGQAALKKGIPVVLDPVGAGATPYRTNTALQLLKELRPIVLRGNSSEVLALASGTFKTRGVDACAREEEAESAAVELARELGAVVAVTGPMDLVTDGTRKGVIMNGSPWMARVTGTGCVASALVAACCAVESDPFLAAVCALSVYGVAGERAVDRARNVLGEQLGPGSYATLLIDSLDHLNAHPCGSEIHAHIE